MSNIYTQLSNEGLAPLSHDSSIERAIRKHMTPRARRHMKGSDLYRRSDPVKRVLARLKRPSRHQPKPEMAEMLSSILRGNTITEADLDRIPDKQLLASSIELLMAMALGGWGRHGDVITNGHYCIESSDFDVANGQLLYIGKPVRFDLDRLYNVRALLSKGTSVTGDRVNDVVDVQCGQCAVYEHQSYSDKEWFHAAHTKADQEADRAFVESHKADPPSDLSAIIDDATRAGMAPIDYWKYSQAMKKYVDTFNDTMVACGYRRSAGGMNWARIS